MELVVEFLLHIYLIRNVPARTEWYTNFRDYIFPWVLTLDVLPDLVLMIATEESSISSDQEWSGGEDTEDDIENSDFLMGEEEDNDDSATT